MKISNPFQFLYGLFMGTSVEFLKTRHRSFPVRFLKISEELHIMLGGVQNCGIVVSNGKICLINTEEKMPHQNSELKRYILNNFPNSKVEESLNDSKVDKQIIENIFIKPVVVHRFESYLFLGPLFYNKVHPDLHNYKVKNLDAWIDYLENIPDHFKVIPGEGPLAEKTDLELFLQYLRDLCNDNVDYQSLKNKYKDFNEIIGLSSLSENMDILRNPERKS